MKKRKTNTATAFKFSDTLEQTLDNSKVQFTENAAVGFASSTSALLDFFYKISSYRRKCECEILDDFAKSIEADAKLTTKLLFYARDCRAGMGEKRIFYICFMSIVKHNPDLAIACLKHIPEYGSWKDVLILTEYTAYNDEFRLFHQECLKLITTQLQTDAAALKQDNMQISLLAKWMPSINTSSAATRTFARYLITEIFKTTEMSASRQQRAYRQLLSKLRARLKVVERKMSANSWSDIDYASVPSKANLIYRDAFFRHDSERRRQFLADVNAGKKNINAGVLMPHEIVQKYVVHNAFDFFMSEQASAVSIDESLEALWTSLSKKIETFDKNLLVVRDGSGSMMLTLNDGGTPLSVATALAIFCAEHNMGEWHDKFVTFSAQPKFIDMSKADTLLDKIKICLNETECTNTNIERVFELVLANAVKHNMVQKDIPDILIISDMEFDSATSTTINAFETLFETIGKQWAEHGYTLPKLIFWNVASRTCTIPMQSNANGLILMSGYSANMINMVIGNDLDPYNALVNTLNVPRYDLIEDAYIANA